MRASDGAVTARLPSASDIAASIQRRVERVAVSSMKSTSASSPARRSLRWLARRVAGGAGWVGGE
jgi:hypothetical protein